VKENTSEWKFFQNILKFVVDCSKTLRIGRSHFHFSWPQSLILVPFDMMHTEENLKCIPQSLLYTVDRGGILFTVLLQVSRCVKWPD